MSPRKTRSNPSIFARNLNSILSERGIGVREAAALAGVSPSTVMGWKSGGTPTDFIAVKQLARALGTTLSFLLVGEHDAPPVSAPSINDLFVEEPPLFDGFARVLIKPLRLRKDPRGSR